MQAKPWYLSPGVWGINLSVLGGVGPLHAWLAAHGLPNLFSDANLNAWVWPLAASFRGGALVALYHQVKAPVIIMVMAAQARRQPWLVRGRCKP